MVQTWTLVPWDVLIQFDFTFATVRNLSRGVLKFVSWVVRMELAPIAPTRTSERDEVVERVMAMDLLSRAQLPMSWSNPPEVRNSKLRPLGLTEAICVSPCQPSLTSRRLESERH